MNYDALDGRSRLLLQFEVSVTRGSPIGFDRYAKAA